MKKTITFVFLFFLYFFSILLFVTKDKEISFFERRRLTTKNQLKGDFFGSFDSYMTDQFPFREEAISLGSYYKREILKNYENNDVYVKGDYLIEKNYPLDTKNVDSFIKKINYIHETYLKNSSTFYTVIPDKGYFLDSEKYLKLDYDSLFERVEEGLSIPYIDLVSKLKLEDYYKTDIHLKQPSYFKVIKELSQSFNFKYQDIKYEEQIYPNFYGSTSSKASIHSGKESLIYLTNDTLKEARVTHLEYGLKEVYDESMLEGIDSYNVFLSGPSALIEIENKKSSSDRELILFRDSFSSSLAPLLLPYYKKITLIDLRYINMNEVATKVDFNQKDVLFIYNTLLIHHSNLLRVTIK